MPPAGDAPVKLLHCADIHLDSPMRGLARYEGAPVEELRQATRRALENAVDLALEEQVACVVIAGDLYDGDRDDYSTAVYLQRQLLRLQEADVPVVVAYGNHDAASEITRRLRPPSNVRLLPHAHAQQVVLEDVGLALHGRSYATRSVTEDLTATYPQPVPGLTNVGVLHTCLDGRPGHEPYAPCTLDALVGRGYDYWALGHVHEREELSRDGVRMVFPGNLQGRHARETGPKGVSLVSYGPDGVSDVEHRSVDVVRWASVEVDITDARTVDDVLERATAAGNEEAARAEERLLALRMTLAGTSDMVGVLWDRQETWEAQLRADLPGASGRVWLEKIKTQVRPAGGPDTIGSDAIDAVRSAARALATDPRRAEALAGELSDLRRQLGAHRQEMESLGGIDLSARGVTALAERVEALLVAALRERAP